MQPHDDRITIPSARLDTLRNLFKAAQEQAWNLASASSQEHSELAATKLALKRELSSLMRPAATSPQDIAADAAARQQARLALLADDDAVDIGHDVFSSVFVEVLAELSLPEPNDGASALDLALTIRALSAIETDLVRSCAGPAVTAAHRSLMLRRIDVMLSAHRLALTGKLLIDQLQFGADAICLIRDGFLRTVPAPMDAEPAVVDLDADMSHVATVPPEQGEAEQAQFVWVEWIREPTPPQKFAVTPDLTVAGLYRRLSSSNHFIEHWMFISPDPMSMRVVFDDNAFVHELLRQYPSSESEPWIARDRHSGMTPTEFLKSGVPKITRKRKQPSEKADHFNQARIKREASHQVTGMRVHKSLDKSSDYGRSPLNSSYSRSQTTSNEHDPQSFTLPEFLAAMDVWRMPDGRRDEIVTSGLQRCDLIVELSFKDSRHALASRAAMSIYLPIKLRCTDLINENADFVAFARDLSNSSSVLYKKINHVLAYAVKARCRFGMLTSGDSTHFFELVHIEGGGIGVFVMDRALTWHQCDTPATPSIRAIFAGMVFELYDMLEFEFKHDSRSVVTGVIIGGTPPASAASSRGTASIQDTEDLQLPASPASHTDIDSEPQAQGPAADADMANSDTAVQQPNSPCKPLQSRFPVIWCNRGGDNFAEEGLKILRQDPEWGPQADGVAHLVIGECIGRGRSASGFAGSLGGESVVIKLLPIDRLDRFFLELRNYERLAKLQGGAIAKLHFAFTFEAYSLGLVVERGKVEIPPRPEDKQLALDALKQIHACGAVHGDAHLGNLAFVGTGESRRAFWFDLERTTFPTKNLQWSQKVDIARFERRWEKGLEGRTSWS